MVKCNPAPRSAFAWSLPCCSYCTERQSYWAGPPGLPSLSAPGRCGAQARPGSAALAAIGMFTRPAAFIAASYRGVADGRGTGGIFMETAPQKSHSSAPARLRRQQDRMGRMTMRKVVRRGPDSASMPPRRALTIEHAEAVGAGHHWHRQAILSTPAPGRRDPQGPSSSTGNTRMGNRPAGCIRGSWRSVHA
jgi:hypothetical protein